MSVNKFMSALGTHALARRDTDGDRKERFMGSAILEAYSGVRRDLT